MEEFTITIKAKHNDEIRRFTLPGTELNWSSIQQHLCRVFTINESTLLSVKYEDDEKELITIGSEEELKLALLTLPKSGNPVFKIYLLTKSAPEIIPFGTNNNNNNNNINNNNDFRSQDRKKRIRVEERKGFDENLKTLIEFGFHDSKLNFRAMKKFYFVETDFPAVIDFLCAQSEKKNKKFKNKQKKKEERENKRLKKIKERNEKRINNNNNNKNNRGENNKRRERREKFKQDNYEEIEKIDWNAIKYLYLDGNNMMFIPKLCRNLIIKKRNKKQVEEILGEIAKEFGIKKILNM